MSATGRYQVWVGQALYYTDTPQETASTLRWCAKSERYSARDLVQVRDNYAGDVFVAGTLADVAALLGDEPSAPVARDVRPTTPQDWLDYHGPETCEDAPAGTGGTHNRPDDDSPCRWCGTYEPDAP